MLDRRIGNLLSGNATPDSITQAITLLKTGEDFGTLTPMNSAPENMLIAAEKSLEAIGTTEHDAAKVDAMLLKQARDCVEHFLCSRPARNQFLVRAYYALGRVQSAEAEPLKMEELTKALLAAASTVQKGIAIAAELGNAHRFLIYNGSVHVYRIVRPLFPYSGDVASSLSTSLEYLLKVLKESEEPMKIDADWRLSLSMQLARCYERAGRKKDAGALLAGCAAGEKGEAALVDKCDPALAEELLQLQAHMALEDAAAIKKMQDEAKAGPTATPRRRALILTQLLADGGPPGDPKAGGFDMAGEVGGAVAALDPDLGAALSTEGGEEAVRKAVLSVNSSSSQGCPDDDLLILLAAAAIRHGLLTIADHCATRCVSSAKLSVRVRSSFIKAQVSVGLLDASPDFPAQGEVYTKRMVSTRIEALKALEEAVNSARRVGDPALVQDGCIIIWNTSLPLLQPSLISYAERALYLAASALEAINSPLAQLRASLHLELARLDATRDFMQKASAHVKKALALDVPADAGTGAEVNPIVRPLRTLGTRLALKTDVYRVAETPEEKVILLLEQARTDRRIPLKKQLLEQTLDEMQLSEPEPTPPGEEPEEGAEEKTPEEIEKEEAEAKKKVEKRRERAALWSELMRAGWALRLSAMARAAAFAVLSPEWSTSTDAELVRDQADARFTLGETYIGELQSLQEKAEKAAADQAAAEAALAAGNVSTRGLPPIAPPGQAEEEAKQRDAVRQLALEAFCAGVEVGLKLKDDLIVQNGCIYVINYNRSLLRNADYAPLLTSLRACVEALKQCDQAAMQKDVQQLRIAASTASALALGLEQNASSPPPAGGGCRTHDSKDAGQAEALKEGIEVCKWSCELCTGHPTLKKQITACWARLQAYGGVKQPAVGTEPEAGALALLELLACGLVDTGAAGADALGKAKELLILDGTPREEPELWVRVAQQAMSLGDLASVVKACDAALRPLHIRIHPEQFAAPAGAPASADPIAKSAAAKKPVESILREEWRWYALAELVHGEAIAKLLKEGQQAALQQQLHANALIHLASSMTYSNNAAEGSLLLSSAQRFWRHVKPFIGATPPDSRLRAPVATALTELEKLDATLQPQVQELRVRLYEAQLAVLAHAQAWSEGLALLNSAFSTLPDEAMRPLWEEKVMFMCKGGGKGLISEMHKLKDFEPQVQAKVWAVLGQAAPTTGEQLNGMLKAVDTLSAEPLQKVQYLIALAQWLYTHDFPLRDSEDQLMAAVDILMDYEDTPDEEEEDDDGAASSAGGTSVSGSSAIKSSRGGTSVTGSKRSGTSGMSGSKVAAEAALSVTQYEQLARIYLMRSMMATTLSARLECAFVGQHYLSRLWEVAVGTSNVAEMAKPDADPAAPPPFTLPKEVHEWAGWEPSEALEAAMAAINNDRVICLKSLPDAQLTVAYLQYAVELLLSTGLHLHALMPLTLIRFISKWVLDSPAMQKATALKMSHVLHQLGLTEKAAATRAGLAELRPTPEAMRKNAVTLRQMKASDMVVTSSAPTAELTEAVENEVMPPPPRPKRKSCARPDEAEWVDLAALLVQEGEWAAAREWLLQAAPLLAARGELEHESRCRRLLAKLHALHGEPAAAVSGQLAAMGLCGLEAEEWAEAVLDLAEYRGLKAELSREAGDDRLKIATLEAAVELVGKAAAEFPSGAVDARLAQAKIQQALGIAFGEVAAEMIGASDEAASAARCFDAAAQTFFELGDQRKAALALVDRASLHDSTPMYVEEAGYILEAEANHLEKLGELLQAAHVGAERAYFLAAPRSLPTKLSLPLARELSSIKCSLATLQLRHAALERKVLAANPTPGPSFPMVEGGDDETIRNFVAPVVVVPPPVHMEYEGRAQLQAASAIALAGSGAPRAKALRANGEVLYARAFVLGWGTTPGRWEHPPPPPEAGAPGPAEGVLAAALGEGEGEEAAEPVYTPPEPGTAEAEAAKAALQEAMGLALAESDLETAQGAALLLARACGVAESDECAKWLALYQACRSHKHWRNEWIAACEPSESVALRARMVQWLPQKWVSPAALPAMQAAEAALAADGPSGCSSWRALSVPSDPLSDLWPLLPGNMRVITITLDGSDVYASLVGAIPGELPPGGLPKGAEPPPPSLTTKVNRLIDVGEMVEALLGDISGFMSFQGKSALQRAKDDIYAVEHKGTECAADAAVAKEAASKAISEGKYPKETATSGILPKVQLSENEMKLRALADGMDAVFGPLLAPLLPLLDAPEGEKINIVLIPSFDMSALPLELLSAFRQPHIAAVSRDLSAPVLAWRLQRAAATPCAAKKSAFGGAVDPRNEVSVPKPADELTSRPPSRGKPAKGKKGAAKSAEEEAAEAEAAKKSRGICTAFTTDVIEGKTVAFGKEWGSVASGAVLLGSDHVPSAAEWQRAMLNCQAFVVEGPGAFYEQVAPSAIAPLKLESCSACLLFDRAASDLASRRLAKEANTKSKRRIALEAAPSTAAMLSLSGVCTVVSNQWATAAQCNHELLTGVLAKLGTGATIGEALTACARGAMVVVPEPEAPAPAPEAAPAEDVTDPAEAAPAAEDVGDAEGAAPAPAPAVPEVNPVDTGTPVWTVLGNPIIYGLPDFKAV